MEKIIGIGNALTDISLPIDNDELLARLNLPKGSMQLIDRQRQEQLSSLLSHQAHTMSTGGSSANCIRVLARLGAPCAFIGKTGSDAVGRFFAQVMRESGVQPLLRESLTPSGQCLVLISPDGERTMCTCLGAAAELQSHDLSADLFNQCRLLHIEGYLVQNYRLLRTAVKLAKESGAQVSLDLGSYNIVEEHADFLRELLSGSVDMVFANEEEARAFTGKEPVEALECLSQRVRIAVVKVGKAGSYVKSSGGTWHVEAAPARSVDTTGAGDSYAAGFLYGIARSLPVETCGKIASLVAARMVETLGTEMDKPTWERLRREVDAEIGRLDLHS